MLDHAQSADTNFTARKCLHLNVCIHSSPIGHAKRMIVVINLPKGRISCVCNTTTGMRPRHNNSNKSKAMIQLFSKSGCIDASRYHLLLLASRPTVQSRIYLLMTLLPLQGHQLSSLRSMANLMRTATSSQLTWRSTTS